MTLGSAIMRVTLAHGETRPFTVRVPLEGTPQYLYDDDPDTPVDVPPGIITEAEDLMEHPAQLPA